MHGLDHPSTDTHDLSGIEHATDDFTDIINENQQIIHGHYQNQNEMYNAEDYLDSDINQHPQEPLNINLEAQLIERLREKNEDFRQ